MAKTLVTLNTSPSFTLVNLNTSPTWNGVVLNTSPSWKLIGTWLALDTKNWEDTTNTWEDFL